MLHKIDSALFLSDEARVGGASSHKPFSYAWLYWVQMWIWDVEFGSVAWHSWGSAFWNQTAAALLFCILSRILFKILMFLSGYFKRRTLGNFLSYFGLLRVSYISDLKLNLYNSSFLIFFGVWGDWFRCDTPNLRHFRHSVFFICSLRDEVPPAPGDTSYVNYLAIIKLLYME